MRIAFIGLGNMGGHMSKHLAAAGVDCTVYDLDAQAATPAVSRGARLAPSAAEAARGVDVVITMLPTPAIIEDVLLGSGGVLAAMPDESLWIDMSTSVPAASRRVATQASRRGIRVMDAPVSGMSKGAEAGTLQIFVGGDAGDLEQVRPLFEVMGDPRRVLHVGAHGSGYAVKLMINLLWFVQLLGIAEVLTVGAKAGVDLSVLHESLVASPANSLLLERDYLSVLNRGDYDEGFALALACKDLGLAVKLAAAVGVPTEVGATVERIFQRARAELGDVAGEMSPVQLYEQAAGLELRLPVTVTPARADSAGPSRSDCAHSQITMGPFPPSTFRVDAVHELPSMVRLAAGAGVLVVTDRGLRDSPVQRAVVERLRSSGLKTEVFADVHPNPTTDDVDAGSVVARRLGPQTVVVALGGGSALDAAKSIALAATNGRPARELAWSDLLIPALRLVAVPTTSGTGAECNDFGVITDSTSHRKFYIGSPTCLAHGVILDPALTLTLPPGPTAASGVDCLTHALESYLSVRANAWADGMNLNVIRLVAANLRRAVDDGSDLEARSNLLLAAHTAGQAMSTTGLGVVHGIAHPLGARHDIAHGAALALVLGECLRFNQPARSARVASLAVPLGVAAMNGSEARNAAAAIAAVEQLVADVSLASSLSAFAIGEQDLPVIVEDALIDPVMANTPRPPTAADIRGILVANF